MGVKLMEDWQLAQLSEEQLAEIKSLESKLGLSLIAYESENSQEVNEKFEN